eukprot:UN09943
MEEELLRQNVHQHQNSIIVSNRTMHDHR